MRGPNFGHPQPQRINSWRDILATVRRPAWSPASGGGGDPIGLYPFGSDAVLDASPRTSARGIFSDGKLAG
jgi:hypothetical protein